MSLVTVMALLAGGCGSPSDVGASTDAAANPASEGGTSEVHVASSELGEILVGPDGNTLYAFTADSSGSSTCNDACADAWPPLAADVVVAADLDQSMFGSISREDGSRQTTVNGMPLYFYAADAGPGDTSGQGINDSWFALDSSGSLIRAETEQTDPSIVDYGY